MSIKFYYGSGSPFAWNVWLTLEHKQLPYEFHLLSLFNGELKKPDYLAINPHGKVPAIIDDGFVVWETLTIVEYLEERYPDHPLLPGNLKEKTLARRLSVEAYNYLYPVIRQLMEQTLLNPEGNIGSPAIADTTAKLGAELTNFEKILLGDFFAGQLSAADFAIYPLLALLRRIEQRAHLETLNQPKLLDFMSRIEQLPYFAKTFPPHWQE